MAFCLLPAFRAAALQPRMGASAALLVQQQQRTTGSVSGKGNLGEEVVATAGARKVAAALREIAANQDTISWEQFSEVATKEGQDPTKLGQALHTAGQIFHAATHPTLKKVVCVRPERLLESVNQVLALDVDRDARLQAVQAELAPLQEKWAQIEASGHSRAKFWIHTSLLGLVAQGAFVARLTWWELSWDIMEPITYMLTFSVALISISYFTLTGAEFSYESLHAVLARRRREKLIRRWNFDKEKYDRLVEEASRLSKAI